MTGQRKGGGHRIQQGTDDRTERGQMAGLRKETIAVHGESRNDRTEGGGEERKGQWIGHEKQQGSRGKGMPWDFMVRQPSREW